MKLLKHLSVLSVVVGFAATAHATAFFQAALWAPELQLVPTTESVAGIRLELYGENKDVTGLELGLFNVTTGNFVGVTGIIIPSIFNKVEGTTTGIQFGLLNETKGEVVAWQAGWINIYESKVTGLQMGFVNWGGDGVKADFTGLQIGLINTAKNAKGVQIGFINYAETLQGLQIGLWNQVNSREWDSFKPLPKVFPFINIGF